jgi:hypothetical protein
MNRKVLKANFNLLKHNQLMNNFLNELIFYFLIFLELLLSLFIVKIIQIKWCTSDKLLKFTVYLFSLAFIAILFRLCYMVSVFFGYKIKVINYSTFTMALYSPIFVILAIGILIYNKFVKLNLPPSSPKKPH